MENEIALGKQPHSMPKEKKAIQPSSTWQTIGASVTGASHVKTNLPCQDAHGFAELPGGLLIAVVSDGAGSAPLAEVGAQTAVSAAMDYLRKYLPTFDPFNEAEEAQFAAAGIGALVEGSTAGMAMAPIMAFGYHTAIG